MCHSQWVWTLLKHASPDVFWKSQFKFQHLKCLQWSNWFQSDKFAKSYKGLNAFNCPFFIWEWSMPTLPKSCLTTHRIRCLDKKQLLQYGSGLDRRRGKNPSEIFTSLALINNLLCLQQDQGFVQISTYFITSETAWVPFMQLTQIQGWSFLT